MWIGAVPLHDPAPLHHDGHDLQGPDRGLLVRTLGQQVHQLVEPDHLRWNMNNCVIHKQNQYNTTHNNNIIIIIIITLFNEGNI